MKPYTDDTLITRHHAIIPTGSSMSDVSTLDIMHQNVYIEIVSRFISIFLPAAIYEVSNVTLKHSLYDEFFGTSRVIKDYGYLEVANNLTASNPLLVGQTLDASFYIKDITTT